MFPIYNSSIYHRNISFRLIHNPTRTTSRHRARRHTPSASTTSPVCGQSQPSPGSRQPLYVAVLCNLARIQVFEAIFRLSTSRSLLLPLSLTEATATRTCPMIFLPPFTGDIPIVVECRASHESLFQREPGPMWGSQAASCFAHPL